MTAIRKSPPKAGPGRPRGSKNKDTVFKEVIRQGFEKSLQSNFEEVLKVVIEKAKQGDMKAAKMLMDRVVPVSKAVDASELKGQLKIEINVGSMEDQRDVKVIDADLPEPARLEQYEEA